MKKVPSLHSLPNEAAILDIKAIAEISFSTSALKIEIVIMVMKNINDKKRQI